MRRWRGITLVFLLLVTGILYVEVRGQNISVPTRSDSDWWSMTRSPHELKAEQVQQRGVAETNFRIAGVDLHGMALPEIYERLGRNKSVQRGDAATSRQQVCYRSYSPEHREYLIFETGEVNSSFYLFSETKPWDTQSLCKPAQVVSNGASTESGLHLGQTPKQVIEILGIPSERQQNQLLYFLESKKATAPDALARARKQHPELTDRQFREDFASYDVTVSICARFARGKMVYLGVSMSETS